MKHHLTIWKTGLLPGDGKSHPENVDLTLKALNGIEVIRDNGVFVEASVSEDAFNFLSQLMRFEFLWFNIGATIEETKQLLTENNWW